jgi:sigma-E factor negative regulatory protein RseB
VSEQSAPNVASFGVASAPTGTEYGLDQWLVRLRQAARVPAYTGTYVVWSAPGLLASSRIWHASRGNMQVEQVDALSGTPRSTYRVTDWRGRQKVETFLFQRRLLRIKRGELLGGGGFPNLPGAQQGITPADYYDAQQAGQERVAGFMTDVVRFVPRDSLRYGYRVWSERRTGLAIKLQTLDERGRVLEQAAFSDLAFDAPVSVGALLRQMHQQRGWRVERAARVLTTAMAEGWQIGGPSGSSVPGFALQNCYRQPVQIQDEAAVPATAGSAQSDARGPVGAAADSGRRDIAARSHSFQCVFSDGLAAVSVFIDRYDPVRQGGGNTGELDSAVGATHLLVRRIGDTNWVAAAVGEVPLPTLRRFVTGVSRLR